MNNGVQFFRGILFLGILSFHCGIPFADLGWGGIEAFLLISAYFQTVKLIKQDGCPAPSGQILRRYKRLIFAYIPVMLLGVIYTVLTRRLPYDFPFHIIFGQNFLWMFTRYSSPMIAITAHTWTLSIDFWLGILWTFVLLSFPANYPTKPLKVFSFVMLVIALAWREAGALFGLDNMLISCCPIAHADAFAIGTLIAVSDRKGLLKHTSIIGAIGICGILVTIKLLADMAQCGYVEAYSLLKNSSFYLANVVTCNLYLYISLFTGAIFKVLIDLAPVVSSRNWFVLMGNVSYELYLFHWPVYVAVRRFISDPYLKTAIVFVLTLISVWLFKKIENSFLAKGMIQ